MVDNISTEIIDPVAFKLGPLGVRWYALIISLGVVLGIWLILREARHRDLDEDFFLDFLLLGIPIGVVGARLYFVLFNFQFYRHNLASVFAFREGGLAIHGGIIAGALVLIILAYRRRMNFWVVVDVISPQLALGEAIGRWGNFINREAYGGIVSERFMSYFPDFIRRQMYIGGNFRNPVFLYFSLWNLASFLFLIWLRRRDFIENGDVFFAFLITYSLGRFIIEPLRVDSLMLGPFRVARLLSLLLIALSVVVIIVRHRKEKGLHAG